MPKQYYVIKWAIYGAATLFFFLLQVWVLDRFSYESIFPFLGPMVVGVVASLEGSFEAPIYGLVVGIFSDLGGSTPSLGFYTFTYALGTLLAALLAERFLSPGFLSALATATIVYGILALGRVAFLEDTMVLYGFSLSLQEFLVTLPCMAVVYPVLSAVHKKTDFNY